MLDNGYVMRWISVDPQGSVRIMTYGEGVNMRWYGIPGGVMGNVNAALGPGIFTNLGLQNQINVRDALLEKSR